MVVDKLLKKYDKKVVVDSVSFSIPKGRLHHLLDLMEQENLQLWE